MRPQSGPNIGRKDPIGQYAPLGAKSCMFETRPDDAGRCPALTDVSLSGKEIHVELNSNTQ